MGLRFFHSSRERSSETIWKIFFLKFRIFSETSKNSGKFFRKFGQSGKFLRKNSKNPQNFFREFRNCYLTSFYGISENSENFFGNFRKFDKYS